MSNYINPLHAPVPSEFHSPYTALSHANPPLEPPFQTSLPPSFKRVPQIPPSSLLLSPRRSCPHVPVVFELIGGGLGIPMRELLARPDSTLECMIVDAIEPVGHLMSGPRGVPHVSLRIPWPGYEHMDWSHSLELCSASGSVTRGQLAVQIAFAFDKFVAQMRSSSPASNVVGWRVGGAGTADIAIERLLLVALWNVRDDHWMAEVFVAPR